MTISCADITENMPYGYALNKLVKDEAGYVRDYIILDVNSQFEEYTEILASEIVGRNASFCEYFGLNNHDLIGSTNISARLSSNQKASPGGSMLTRFRTMLPGSIPTQSMSL